MANKVISVLGLGMISVPVKEVIVKSAKTQAKIITEQLEAGIRYFDLRVVRS